MVTAHSPRPPVRLQAFISPTDEPKASRKGDREVFNDGKLGQFHDTLDTGTRMVNPDAGHVLYAAMDNDS